MLRTELQLAEGELKDRCWAPPIGLQQWLQLTHEIENKAYLKKKIAAEKQLQQAREAVCKTYIYLIWNRNINIWLCLSIKEIYVIYSARN